MDDNFVKRLRDARIRSGIKQKQIADYLQVSEQAVGKWFRTGQVAKERLHPLADLLNVKLSWLMTGETLQGDTDDTPQQKELIRLFSSLDKQEKEDVMKAMREKNELRAIREELAHYKSNNGGAHA